MHRAQAIERFLDLAGHCQPRAHRFQQIGLGRNGHFRGGEGLELCVRDLRQCGALLALGTQPLVLQQQVAQVRQQRCGPQQGRRSSLGIFAAGHAQLIEHLEQRFAPAPHLTLFLGQCLHIRTTGSR